MEVYREAALTAIVTILLIIVLLWVYDLIYELRHLNKYPRPTVDTSQSELQLVLWGQNPEFSKVGRYQDQYRRNSSIRSVAPVKLQMACYNCDVFRIATFIKGGVDILQKTQDGETGLLLATYQMAKKRRPWSSLCLHILVSNGCLVNEPTLDGNTALHIAVKQNHLAVTKWLLNHGASVYIANRKGWTPMDIAVAQRRQDIVDVLQEAEDVNDINEDDEEKGSREAEDTKDSSEHHSAL